MTALTSPTGLFQRRLGRVIAFSAATALAASTAVAAIATAAPAAAADLTFSSSFESDDPQPQVSSPYGDLHNFTGERFAPGSLLGLVADVTGTGESPSKEPPEKLADANAATKWLVRSKTAEATYELSEAAAITEYTLTSGNDAEDRDPEDFVVQGSTDGDEWEDIDTQEGQSWAKRSATNTYTLEAKSAEYSYYRLKVTANSGASLLQIADWELIDTDRPAQNSPMVTEVASGPSSSHTAKTGVGFTGTKSLQYAGQVQTDGDAGATNELFDVDIAIASDSQLSYKIFPVLDSALTYSATHVAVDLVFESGEQMSADASVTDAYGFAANASAQGQANILWPDQWNSINIDLGQFEGKTVKKVLFSYNQPDATAGTPVLGYVDDITIDKSEPRDTSDGLVSYVDTRRGTNSTGGFSRGNTIPAAAWPNGFNFITPMTNADSHGTLYHYQRENNSENLPGLNGIGMSHQPSIWMGDRNQLAVIPAANDNPTSNLNDRRLSFKHENEIARPDLYSVEFENGLTTAVTPTDHGAIYQFGFTGDNGSVLVDQVDGSSDLTVAADGSVTGWVNGGSGYPGRTRMFIHGQFDTTPTKVSATTEGDRNESARFAAFDTSVEKTVELRIASSFISQDQAEKNYGFELDSVSYDTALTAVQNAWNERLSVITDVEGATDTQLVTLYSSLYRLNLYPNSQFENTGTAADPVHRYASPVSAKEGDSASDAGRDAKVVDGKMYVNNGFWDTYRTAWPAYAMLYPEQTEELVDGFVEQYREGGWVARWSSPGYADLMTGTSSDVSFAEAYLSGSLSTELALEAYDAAVKNATVLPTSAAVGRKGLDKSIFLGYTDSGTHESASWGLEGFINDFGIAEMAKALAEDEKTPTSRKEQLLDEAEYFEARSHHYVEMYNPDAGVFTARHADGSWAEDGDFNKFAWGGAFTEASAWTFAFHAPHDVDGLAALYGGRQGLLDELDEFLTTPERAEYSGIHEAREARDVRIGMLGMSNQVAHHIPYVLAEAGAPAKAQKLIREIQQRLFAGSDIGQGYPGDEDNGEFSAWFMFSALGFYPLEVGSGDYTIGSPLFDSATVNFDGNPLKVTAPGASDGKVYVGGVEINGEKIDATTLDGDLIRNGGELKFTMSDEPTTWGNKDLTEDLEIPEVLVDATKSGFGVLSSQDGSPVDALTDDNMRSAVTFDADSAELTWESASGPVAVHQYTLTSTTGAEVGDPQDWILEGSNNGEDWTELDKRAEQEFPFSTQTRPFSVAQHDASFTQIRLTISTTQGDKLGLAEIELFAKAVEGADLSVSAGDDQRVGVNDEFTRPLATVVGDEATADGYKVSVQYGDSADPETDNVVLKPNGLGGWIVSAPHTFDAPGIYPATVTVEDSTGSLASASIEVTVFRDETLTGMFNNVCIGDLNETAASCDGQNYGYFRDKLADDGFVQGATIGIPDTELSFDLPDIPAGEPDNITGEGQTVQIDLGENATQLSLIGTGTESGKELTGTLTYSDGSTQEVPIEFGDWVGNSGNPSFENIVLAVSEGRLSGTDEEGTVKNTAIYATQPFTLEVDDADVPKTVVSLTLPQEEGTLRNDGRAHLFAIASDGDRDTVADLTVTASEVTKQQAGTEFEAELATVAGGHNLDAATAVVNWGDGTTVSSVAVDDSAVTAVHEYAEAGTYKVWVTVDDGVKSVSGQLQIVVEDDRVQYEPEIVIEPDVVQPGDVLTVTGTGFADREAVDITFGSEPAVTVEAAADGTLTADLTVPTTATDGDYPVVAVGAVSNVAAEASVRVEVPVSGPEETAVTLDASEVDPVVGEAFQLTASLAPQGASGQVEFLEGEQVIGTATVSGGAAMADVRAETSGEHTYTARFLPDDTAAFTSSVSAELTLNVRSAPVLEAEISLSVDEIEQGGSLTVTGRGYAPGEVVKVELHSDPVLLDELESDETGSFSIEVVVPADTEVGAHQVVVTGADSALVADASLTVLSPASSGGDGAGGDGDAGNGAGAGGDSDTDGAEPDGWLPTTGGDFAAVGAVILTLMIAGGIILAVRGRSVGVLDEEDEV